MLEYRSFFIEVIPLPLKQRSSYYKNCIIFYYYKNRSIAEISKENSGEKYLFSLYPIPTHDYFLGLLIFCSLTCLFFFSFFFSQPLTTTLWCVPVLQFYYIWNWKVLLITQLFPSKSKHVFPTYFLKMEVPGLCPILIKSESLGVGP